MDQLLVEESDRTDLQKELLEKAKAASGYLKAMANETRLAILCHLARGPKTVSELEVLIGARQANVSQHLSRLKDDELVYPERFGQTVSYSICDLDALEIINVLHGRFCGDADESARFAQTGSNAYAI